MTLFRLHVIFRSIALFTSLMSGVFVLDFILPANQNHQTVIDSIWYGSKSGTKMGIRTETDDIPIEKDLYNVARMGNDIIVYKTRILEIVKNIQVKGQLYQPICVYNLYGALPLSALVFGLFAFWKIKKGNGNYTTAAALNVASFLGLILAFFLNQSI